ncbi:MAG: hypothetical protein M3044_00185 [Thermoproteota archaeon]|nr:hypothetical protein [Thermoproteota archaeon]
MSTRTILNEPQNDIYKVEQNMLKGYLDIKSVSYSSDGRTLTASIWLNSTLCQKPPCFDNHDIPRYGMKIFVTNNKNPDYDIYTERGENGTWKQFVLAYEPTTQLASSQRGNETISGPVNSIDFLKNGNRHINLSFNLSDIGSPTRYYIYFYTANKTGFIQDLTFAYRIPPQANIISFGRGNFTEPVRLSFGTSKILPIMVNSNDLAANSTLQFKLANKYPHNSIKLEFIPDKIDLPLSGVTLARMAIAVPWNTAPGNYTFYLQRILSTYRGGNETDNSILPVQVLPFKGQPWWMHWWLTYEALVPTAGVILIPLICYAAYVIKKTRKFEFPIGILLRRFKSEPIQTGERLRFEIPYPSIDLRSQKSPRWALNVSDVLEVDATIIIGVLILLTVTSSILARTTFVNPFDPQTTVAALPVLTSELVLPFSASAVIAIWRPKLPFHNRDTNNTNNTNNDDKTGLGAILMLAGFINLPITLFMIFVGIG